MRFEIKKLYSRRWGWYGFFTHIHHVERCPIEQTDTSGDIEDRIRYINRGKMPHERSLRKALIRRVPDYLLPKVALELLKAERKYNKAVDRYEELKIRYSYSEYPDGRKGRARDLAKTKRDVLDLRVDRLKRRVERIGVRTWIDIHKKVCHPNCPWTPRNHIFSKGYSTRVLKKK